MVRRVREKLKNTVTLAIGDGANDIAMIQEAHVGIGISGREGLQAARSSDYSIARFRFLRNLLFVHGRWSYIRVAKFVLGTFYKCICFYLTQGIFQYFTGFSGTSLYEQWTLSFYNTLFSSLPVLVIGIFEKDLKKKTLLAVPELYQMGQRNGAFTIRIFFTWMAAGVAQAFVILLIPFFLHSYYGGYELRVEGSPQLYEIGLVVYTSIVHVVTIKIAYLECHNWTWITHVSSLLTLFGWFLYQTIYSFIYPTKSKAAAYDVNGVFQRAGQQPQFWLTVIVTVSFAIMPNYVLKAIRAAIAPTDVDIYQQIEKDKDLLNRVIGEGHAVSGGEVQLSPVLERQPAG
jgi:magnesium-transporting ATPase (P-type)